MHLARRDLDDVEAHGRVLQPVLLEVEQCGAEDAGLLGTVDGLGGGSEASAAPALDLHEYHRAVLLGDHVDLPGGAAVAHLQDGVALADEVVVGGVFALRAVAPLIHVPPISCR